MVAHLFFWFLHWSLFEGGGLKIFGVVGHIQVDTFLQINYFFDAKHASSWIFLKGQANPRKSMTSQLAFLSQHYKVLTDSQIGTVTCLGGGLLAMCGSRVGAYSRGLIRGFTEPMG